MQATETERDIISAIEQLGEQVGRCPKLKEFKAADNGFAEQDVRLWFSTWGNAVTIVGYDRPSQSPPPENRGKFKAYEQAKDRASCDECGQEDNIVFHHPEGVEKVDGASRMRGSPDHTLQDLLIEINKCVPLCRGCHNTVHGGD